MLDEDDDPLLLFTGHRAAACEGEWRTDRLGVRISTQDGRLVLESGTKELELTEVGFNTWSAADPAVPDKELYVAKVSGYGRDTVLTLRAGAKHEGSNKMAVLRRVEHLGDDEGQEEITEGRAGQRSLDGREVRPIRTVEEEERISDDEGLAAVGTGRAEEAGRRGLVSKRRRGTGRSRQHASTSRPRSYLRLRRSPERGARSRSAGRRSPRGAAPGSGNEEITTLFVTQLPDDAREDEVRADCEWVGAVNRVVLMRRGAETNAFVRYEHLKDARRAMDRILDGKLKVCQARVKAEMARRNTN
mmetsp:Transcript_55525/g.119845  ORF Transcript_55525/g.119845 Transcript_55525/m.119845 type:complete len:303 (-) Transcript_55525:123-1031(-)